MSAIMEQYSLRWNNFHSNLTQGFHSLLEASDMVDVTIAVEGTYLQAHKIVLSICSPYFKELFKVTPCKHPIVVIRDVGHRNMRDILEFMYLGEVNVLRENLPSFLRTAELLQVKGLTGDDSSDTSSKKDEKVDSLPETEEEDYSVSEPETHPFQPLADYLPATVPSTQPQQQQQEKLSAKRNRSSLNATNGKKSRPDTNKTETTGNTDNVGVTDELNDNSLAESQNQNVNVKLETPTLSNFDMDDSSKDAFGQGFDSSNMAKTDTSNNDQGSCQFCGKAMRRSSLRRHMYDVHMPSRQAYCDLCGKVFKTTNSLTTHMITIHKLFKSDRIKTRIEHNNNNGSHGDNGRVGNSVVIKLG